MGSNYRTLKQRYFLSDAAAQHCAQNILRYKETHGENSSDEQAAKMMQISRELEHKEYGYRSSSRDAPETEFFRCREGNPLFRHGFGYDASRDLEHMDKSLECVQRQMAQEREHSKQMEMGL